MTWPWKKSRDAQIDADEVEARISDQKWRGNQPAETVIMHPVTESVIREHHRQRLGLATAMPHYGEYNGMRVRLDTSVPPGDVFFCWRDDPEV